MKKTFAVLFALLIFASLFAGCAKKETAVIRLGGLKGPTSMGMVKLLDDTETGKAKSKVEFTMEASADLLVPKLLGAEPELDILAVPVNLASVLYNNSKGGVKFLAINTLGVVYIVEKGERQINSFADLKGQTLYATGKGMTPEYVLKYLLAENGLEPEKDVAIEWKSQPTEVIAAMQKDEHAIAMMPQPFVTAAQAQLEGLNVVLDLTEEWGKIDNGSKLITAGLVVRSEFAKQHPAELAQFLKEYKASAEFLNANVKEGAQLVVKYGILPKAPIAEKAIPFCNVTYIDGAEMVPIVNGYLKVLFDQNPKSIGGKLPGNDFFYVP